MIGIVSAAYRLPASRRKVSDWCRIHQVGETHTQALIESGADEYNYVDGESIDLLAYEAIEDLLVSAEIPRQAINALVFFNTSQCNVFAPPESTVNRIRTVAKLTSAVAFSISQQNCVSAIHALRVIDALFESHSDWQYAIIVGVDIVLKDELRAIGLSGIHSDAASALLVSRDQKFPRITAIETFNDPRLIQGILDDGSYEENDNYLWSTLSVIRRVLKKAGIGTKDISTVLPHNTNLPGWLRTLQSLQIPASKLFSSNFARIGHAFGSDIAVNMVDANVLQTPGFHLVFSSGIGGCFGSFIIHCEK